LKSLSLRCGTSLAILLVMALPMGECSTSSNGTDMVIAVSERTLRDDQPQVYMVQDNSWDDFRNRYREDFRQDNRDALRFRDQDDFLKGRDVPFFMKFDRPNYGYPYPYPYSYPYQYPYTYPYPRCDAYGNCYYTPNQTPQPRMVNPRRYW
jgi:hypothetical protein